MKGTTKGTGDASLALQPQNIYLLLPWPVFVAKALLL